MKKRAFSLLVVLSCMVCVSVALADTDRYVYPTDNPVFSFELPDDWTVEMGDKGLSAMPSDESLFVMMVFSEGKALDDLADMLDAELENLLSEFEIEEKGTIETNGLVISYNDGPAVLKEDGSEIYASVNYFTTDAQVGCFVIYFGDDNTPEEQWEMMNDILNSFTAE